MQIQLGFTLNYLVKTFGDLQLVLFGTDRVGLIIQSSHVGRMLLIAIAMYIQEVLSTVS